MEIHLNYIIDLLLMFFISYIELGKNYHHKIVQNQ
jgi:hypothetical protein